MFDPNLAGFDQYALKYGECLSIVSTYIKQATLYNAAMQANAPQSVHSMCLDLC